MQLNNPATKTSPRPLEGSYEKVKGRLKSNRARVTEEFGCKEQLYLPFRLAGAVSDHRSSSMPVGFPSSEREERTNKRSISIVERKYNL